MIAALQEYVVPVLRTKSFSGSFPHFRRCTDAAVHLLTFQFNRRGGSFVVEVASCSPEGIMTHGGERILAMELKATDVDPSLRLRLGATDKRPDHWFKFNGRFAWNRYVRAAKTVLPFLSSQAEEWWTRPQENERRG